MDTNMVLAIQFDPERVIFQEDGMIYLKVDREETSVRLDMFDEKGSTRADTISQELKISTVKGICFDHLKEKELVPV
jgi:hypothetical protein